MRRLSWARASLVGVAIPSFACTPPEPAPAPSAPSAPHAAAPSEPALRLYWAGLDTLLADPGDADLRSLFGARGALESAEFLRWPCLLVIDGEATAPRGQLTVRTSSAETALALASSLEPLLLALPTANGAARVVRPGWKVTSLGADGAPGGAGLDRDFDSRALPGHSAK